jgi:hypothetical protein
MFKGDGNGVEDSHLLVMRCGWKGTTGVYGARRGKAAWINDSGFEVYVEPVRSGEPVHVEHVVPIVRCIFEQDRAHVRELLLREAERVESRLGGEASRGTMDPARQLAITEDGEL